MNIKIQLKPNLQELNDLFTVTFNNLHPKDSIHVPSFLIQRLDEWISIKELIKYYHYGKLIEARNDSDKLVGALFVGQRNPILWPDGHVAEIFILGVLPEVRGQGIGSKLISEAEKQVKNIGGEGIIISTHILMEGVRYFYKKLGYQEIGILKNFYINGDSVFFKKNL